MIQPESADQQCPMLRHRIGRLDMCDSVPASIQLNPLPTRGAKLATQEPWLALF